MLVVRMRGRTDLADRVAGDACVGAFIFREGFGDAQSVASAILRHFEELALFDWLVSSQPLDLWSFRNKFILFILH